MGRVVSPAEIKRQIEREGGRHGLRPVFHLGQCMVAQRELVLESGPVCGVVRETWDAFRSVDMDHPLSNIWRSRKQRHQHNIAKLAMDADKRRKEVEDAALAERRHFRGIELHKAARQVGVHDFWKAIYEVNSGGANTG